MKTFSIPLNYELQYSLIFPSKVKVPKEIEVPVFLIRHELQTRMLYKHLHAIGFQGCYFENFLDRLILASLRMRDGTDETYKVYFDLMEKWTDNINPDDDVITRRALKVYAALIKVRDSGNEFIIERSPKGRKSRKGKSPK